jgi:hypothetical protein
VPLVPKAAEAVKKIIKAHRVANQMSALLAGRITHPVTLTPGGMTRIPTEQELRDLKSALEDVVPDLVDICKVVLSVAGNLPAFERPTEYVSLRQTNPFYKNNLSAYSFYHGDITSTDSTARPTCLLISGKTSPMSMLWRNRPPSGPSGIGIRILSGPWRGLNNQAEYLSPLGKTVADMFGLKKAAAIRL